MTTAKLSLAGTLTLQPRHAILSGSEIAKSDRPELTAAADGARGHTAGRAQPGRAERWTAKASEAMHIPF